MAEDISRPEPFEIAGEPLSDLMSVKLPNLSDIFYHRRWRKAEIDAKHTRTIIDLLDVDKSRWVWTVVGSDNAIYNITWNSDEKRWEELAQ